VPKALGKAGKILDFPENKQIPNPVNNATPPTYNPTNSYIPNVSGSGAGVKIGLAVYGQAPSAGKLQKDFRVDPGPADGASSDTSP
jgi:hypothetical protein